MPAGRYDFTGEKAGVRRGETFARTLTWLQADGVTPVDLTGYAAAMQVRREVGADAVLTMDTTLGGITLGGTAGTIALAADAAATAVIIPGKYAYDLRLTSAGGVVTYLLAGGFEVLAALTTE